MWGCVPAEDLAHHGDLGGPRGHLYGLVHALLIRRGEHFPRQNPGNPEAEVSGEEPIREVGCINAGTGQRFQAAISRNRKAAKADAAISSYREGREGPWNSYKGRSAALTGDSGRRCPELWPEVWPCPPRRDHSPRGRQHRRPSLVARPLPSYSSPRRSAASPSGMAQQERLQRVLSARCVARLNLEIGAGEGVPGLIGTSSAARRLSATASAGFRFGHEDGQVVALGMVVIGLEAILRDPPRLPRPSPSSPRRRARLKRWLDTWGALP